jgi:HAMP domain-containing protein
MRLVRRILQLAGAALAFASYVWFAAVRLAPAVKRRKAARRAARKGTLTGS